MKLKKIAKYLDGIANTNLWIGNEIVWSGSMLEIHAALDKNKDKKRFLRECIEDEDFDTVKRVKTVEKYLDYKIVNDVNYEAVSVQTIKNDVGVTLVQFDITITKK